MLRRWLPPTTQLRHNTGNDTNHIGEQMAQTRLISLQQAVRRYSWDGMQYASGAALPIGSDAIIFGRELLRQGRRDLHAIFHCNSQQLNLLAAAGVVTKAECGFSALEVFGFANGLRRAVESGHMALEDYSTSDCRCDCSAAL